MEEHIPVDRQYLTELHDRAVAAGKRLFAHAEERQIYTTAQAMRSLSSAFQQLATVHDLGPEASVSMADELLQNAVHDLDKTSAFVRQLHEPTDQRIGPLYRVIVCGACGQQAARIALTPPNHRPVDWNDLPPATRSTMDGRPPRTWWFRYSGVMAGNGTGDPVSEQEAARYYRAFAEPSYESVRLAALYDDAGYCAECRVPYCQQHWNVSDTGGGRCPRGHFKSLDPHWSPDD